MTKPLLKSRGQASLLVLGLMMMVISFAAVALMLQKPASQAAEIQSSLQQAQFAATGALQVALANLDAGKPPAVQVSLSESISAEATSESLASVREIKIVATGRAPARAQDNQPAQATVQLVALAVKTASGAWRLKEYTIADARLR